MRLIRAFPISFLFGDLCCAFAPCRKDSMKRDVMHTQSNIHSVSQRAMNRDTE